jgi:hypothetical protein
MEPSRVEALEGDIDNAGAVLLHMDLSKLEDKSTKKIIDVLPDVPWGLYIEGDEVDAAMITGAGADFVVFPASGRAWIPPTEVKIGKILEVESSMDDGLIRAANSLPVDAVLVTDTFESGSLTWHQLMIYQHMDNLLSKPLIVNAPAEATDEEIKALWEACVDGIVVDTAGMKAGRLRELREAIGKLPARSTRKKGKVDATLPRMGGRVESVAPVPDEEEEEEDE